MSWYLKVLQDYVGFNGRAARQEYWMFTLFYYIIMIIVGFLDVFVLNSYPTLSTLYSLAFFLPSLAVTWRRLHDTGRSGAWFFILFVPFAGIIILLVFLCLDSQPYDNQYGPNPKVNFIEPL